ncbi:MAG: glycerol kinase, partial [Alphaproteobacteria bacterium]|nr:glycerol kinase [Alphaproteobacteria bacterium]
MQRKQGVVSIDQGTTSTRACWLGENSGFEHVAQREYSQFFPQSGWVEQDAETIWSDTLATCREVISHAGGLPAAIGITNQRETLIVWERATGKPIHRAIVWQDRRGADHCARLKAAGLEPLVHAKTGLLIDPYFSATKLAWILDNVEGARADAEAGKLAAGTVDSFLLWRLTKGRVHATDATNASRTLLFNIATQSWDADLLELFGVPASLLPEVRDTVADYGETDPEWFGAPVPIRALVGDQQSAAVGQGCFAPGMWKSTYGTGCFVLRNTGNTQVESHHRLLSTVGYRLNGEVTYAQEGGIFMAGAAVKWLRDKLGLIASSAETAQLAASVSDTGGVHVVPAFTGLGAPYWDMGARGAILGMTLDTGKAHIVRATLESVAFQTRDLLEAFAADAGHVETQTLRVDGGMVANDWFCQSLAD